jgi:uncharacterized RDD family membrane protein YckC
VIQAILSLGLLALAATVDGSAVAAAVVVLLFGVQFGYWILFETLGGGRTPGKRVAHLRVIRQGGDAISFRDSAVRTLLRIVDFLPAAYLVGIIVILASPENQRLGDLAAGTIVIRERTVRTPEPLSEPVPVTAETERPENWDISAVTDDNLATVRNFLERRHHLTSLARARVAHELAARLRSVVHTPIEEPDDETFLEKLAATRPPREW